MVNCPGGRGALKGTLVEVCRQGLHQTLTLMEEHHSQLCRKIHNSTPFTERLRKSFIVFKLKA